MDGKTGGIRSTRIASLLSAAAVDRWAERWSDRLNPILVKETRQVFKTRTVVWSFMFALAAAWLTAFLFCASASQNIDQRGDELFAALCAILAVALFFVVPFVAFRSVAAERDRDTLEMLAVTSLSNRQIFWGKLNCALLQTGLFYAAFAPFIAMTYHLRGIDLLMIAAGLVIIMIAAVALTVFGLMLGSLSRETHWQILGTIVLLGTSLVVWSIVMTFVSELSRAGAGEMLFGLICLLFIAGSSTLFCGAVTVGNLRPVPPGLVRLYVNRERLHEIALAARDFAQTVQQHFPETAKPKIPVSADAYSQTLQTAIRLERLLNPSRRAFASIHHHRFLTVAGAADPLRQICLNLNHMIMVYRWYTICDRTNLGPPPEPILVPPIEPERLSAIEQAAAELDLLPGPAGDASDSVGEVDAGSAPDNPR